MSEATTPKGLRKEDVDKGMIGKVAELPYLPLVDEKGAAEANEKGNESRSSYLTTPRSTYNYVATVQIRSSSLLKSSPTKTPLLSWDYTTPMRSR